MLSYESNGKEIIVRGRSEDGGRYQYKRPFTPYFYVPSKDGEYISLFGDKLKKVECDSTFDLVNERKRYKVTFESDVPHANKFLIDNFKEIKPEPIRVCFLDIETEDRDGFPDIEIADKQILSIALYDSFTKKYFALVTSPNKKSVRGNYDIEYDGKDSVNVEYLEYKTENEMLAAFIKIVVNFDFDIFYAWNGEGFDYPMIFNRINRLKLPVKNLSPIKAINPKTKYPRGRAFMDLMKAHRKLSTQEMESYALDYIGEMELGSRKVVHKEKIGDMWEHDMRKFVKYNVKDVYLMVGIEAKKGITDYFDTIRRTTYCNWDDLLWNSKVLDTFALKYAHELDIVLPAKNYGKDDEAGIQGARVLIPEVGIHKGAAVLDVTSLYPSAILTCNMSPETIIDENYAIEHDIQYCKVDDICFRVDKRGFVPLLVERLWGLRQDYKKIRNQYDMDSIEYKKWDTTQSVCKALLNSIYGVLLLKVFRLYNRNVGKSITYFGREYNKYMESLIIGDGYKPMYGDSVTGDTKVSIVSNNEMGLCKIEDLFTHVCCKKGDKEYCKLKNTFTATITDDGKYLYKKVPYVMRHKANKNIYRVRTGDVHVNVTEDHSLIIYKDGGMVEAKPTELIDSNCKLIKYVVETGIEYHDVDSVEKIDYHKDEYVYDIEVEDTHRFFANNILVHNTDSIAFQLHETGFEERIKEANAMNDKINSLNDKWCEDRWGTSKYNKLNLEMEQIYESLLIFPSRTGKAAKKRYCGLVYYKDGVDLRDEPELCMKGISAKRSDSPSILRNLQKEVFVMVLNGQCDEARERIKKVRFDITNNKYTPEELAFPKGMSKNIDEYTKTTPIHIRGAEYANTFCGENIKREKIKFIYVKDCVHPRCAPPTNVISFMEHFPEGYSPDWVKMAEKLIDYQYDTLYKCMGWDINELKGQISLAAFM